MFLSNFGIDKSLFDGKIIICISNHKCAFRSKEVDSETNV